MHHGRSDPPSAVGHREVPHRIYTAYNVHMTHLSPPRTPSKTVPKQSKQQRRSKPQGIRPEA
eukprot:43939-Eustigmatos_ZCMA.PRE.1